MEVCINSTNSKTSENTPINGCEIGLLTAGCCAAFYSKLHADLVRSLKPGQFMCDIHLEELLVFPPATDFHDHPLYKEGAIILQDKVGHSNKFGHDVPSCIVCLIFRLFQFI